MCTDTPDISKPTVLQAQKEPVFDTDSEATRKTGRRSTILTGGSGVVPSAQSGKKTLLGQ